jgi:hypothetical protein
MVWVGLGAAVVGVAVGAADGAWKAGRSSGGGGAARVAEGVKPNMLKPRLKINNKRESLARGVFATDFIVHPFLSLKLSIIEHQW